MSGQELALHGGAMARPGTQRVRIVSPGAWAFDQAEIDRVLEVLKHRIFYRHWGSEVAGFEKEFAQRLGASYAIALNSGTSALSCAFVALGVKAGDEVIMPCYAFLGVASAVLACGARPVFCEIDSTFTISTEHAAHLINERTQAIVAVHMRGAPCDMDGLLTLCSAHQINLIEDVAQSCGASYKGKRLGTLGDIGCFSLQHFKVITTGEGGLCLTNDLELYRRVLYLHDGAAHWSYNAGAPNRVLPYSGLNLRMGEIEGAIGRIQLQKLDTILEKLRTRKMHLVELLGNLSGCTHQNYHDPEGAIGLALLLIIDSKLDAQEIETAVNAEGIEAALLLPPRYTTAQRHFCDGWGHVLRSENLIGEHQCENGRDLLERTLQIQIDPSHGMHDLQEIAQGLRKVFHYFTR